jgi:DUF4097 and DUF4098 domain-containing protein YvlB
MTETEELVQETFVVGETPLLTLSNVVGSITVESDNRANVQVTGVKRTEGCQEPEHTHIEMHQEGDQIVVRTRLQDKTRWLGLRKGPQACAVDYTVRVPTHCEIKVNQVSGEIQVRNISGRVTVNAVDGSVELHDIGGRTCVKAVNARVNGEKWSGQAKIETVSGPVQIGGAHLLRVKGNTVSGAFSLETGIERDGRYDFRSVSGDVTLYLRSGDGVVSRGKTMSGRLVCDLPHEVSRRNRSSWRATVNGGGPPVRFTSVSGDMAILAANHET